MTPALEAAKAHSEIILMINAYPPTGSDADLVRPSVAKKPRLPARKSACCCTNARAVFLAGQEKS
jgi:hypothetical protein